MALGNTSIVAGADGFNITPKEFIDIYNSKLPLDADKLLIFAKSEKDGMIGYVDVVTPGVTINLLDANADGIINMISIKFDNSTLASEIWAKYLIAFLYSSVSNQQEGEQIMETLNVYNRIRDDEKHVKYGNFFFSAKVKNKQQTISVTSVENLTNTNE